MQATSKHPLSEVVVYPEDHGITRSPGEVPKWTPFIAKTLCCRR